MINIDWTNLKSFSSQRSVPIQYVSVNNIYYIWSFDSPMYVTCQIPIVSPTPGGSDQEDFENNYLANANQSPRQATIQHLGVDTFTLTPFGAFSGSTLVGNTTTNWDIVIPQTMTFKGAELYSANSAIGDYVTVTLIDKDNVTGGGGSPGSPTVISTYVISWYIAPNVWNKVEDISISSPLLAGLYFRFAYTSTSSTAPKAIVNFFSYVGTP